MDNNKRTFTQVVNVAADLTPVVVNVAADFTSLSAAGE